MDRRQVSRGLGARHWVHRGRWLGFAVSHPFCRKREKDGAPSSGKLLPGLEIEGLLNAHFYAGKESPLVDSVVAFRVYDSLCNCRIRESARKLCSKFVFDFTYLRKSGETIDPRPGREVVFEQTQALLHVSWRSQIQVFA